MHGFSPSFGGFWWFSADLLQKYNENRLRFWLTYRYVSRIIDTWTAVSRSLTGPKLGDTNGTYGK